MEDKGTGVAGCRERMVTIDYGDYRLDYAVSGRTMVGLPLVLLEQDDNLIGKTDWSDVGYTITPLLFGSERMADLSEGITKLVASWIAAAGGQLDSDFSLERYHSYVDDALHARIAKSAVGIPISHFPIDIVEVEQVISRLCCIEVCVDHIHRIIPASFSMRLIRPSSNDNNPLHRDVWLDHLRHAVNIYLPLAGSSEQSSLGIVPGSHTWMESEIERTCEGSLVNGILYTVPAVTRLAQGHAVIRPNPSYGEVMVFSPYCIHGGGVNRQERQTRVSLEIRFWRKRTKPAVCGV